MDTDVRQRKLRQVLGKALDCTVKNVTANDFRAAFPWADGDWLDEVRGSLLGQVRSCIEAEFEKVCREKHSDERLRELARLISEQPVSSKTGKRRGAPPAGSFLGAGGGAGAGAGAGAGSGATTAGKENAMDVDAAYNAPLQRMRRARVEKKLRDKATVASALAQREAERAALTEELAALEQENAQLEGDLAALNTLVAPANAGGGASS